MKLSISRQLLIGVVISSAIITALVTIIHLYRDYNTQLEFSIEKFDALMQTNKEALENSIWDINENQIDSVLNGFKALPTLDYIALQYERAEGQDTKTVGTLPKNGIEKSYDLTYEGNKVGTITFATSKGHIYGVLWSELGTIVLLNLIKTFLASFLILYIINFLLTKHLLSITEHLKESDPSSLDKIKLQRHFDFLKQDELQQLTESINLLLEKSYHTNELLEYTVKERTQQLNSQVITLKRLQTALDQISLFTTIDSKGNIHTCNKKFVDYFGTEGESLQGSPFISSKYFKSNDIQSIQTAIRSEQKWRGEVQCFQNDSDIVWLMLSIWSPSTTKFQRN